MGENNDRRMRTGILLLLLAFLAGLSFLPVYAQAKDIRKLVAYEEKEDGYTSQD